MGGGRFIYSLLLSTSQISTYASLLAPHAFNRRDPTPHRLNSACSRHPRDPPPPEQPPASFRILLYTPNRPQATGSMDIPIRAMRIYISLYHILRITSRRVFVVGCGAGLGRPISDRETSTLAAIAGSLLLSRLLLSPLKKISPDPLPGSLRPRHPPITHTPQKAIYSRDFAYPLSRRRTLFIAGGFPTPATHSRRGSLFPSPM